MNILTLAQAQNLDPLTVVQAVNKAGQNLEDFPLGGTILRVSDNGTIDYEEHAPHREWANEAINYDYVELLINPIS